MFVNTAHHYEYNYGFLAIIDRVHKTQIMNISLAENTDSRSKLTAKMVSIKFHILNTQSNKKCLVFNTNRNYFYLLDFEKRDYIDSLYRSEENGYSFWIVKN